jgi:hypothetical protein
MEKPENVSDAYPIAITALCCAVIVILSLGLFKYSCMDFCQIWTISQIIQGDPATKIYDPGEQSRLGLEYFDRAMAQPDAPRLHDAAQFNQTLKATSSPFLYSCFSTFATRDYEHDLIQFQFFTMGCMLGAIYLLYRATQTSLLATLILAAFLLVFFAPYTSDAKVGNVNQIQLLLFAAMLVTQLCQTNGLNFFSGIIMGLALAFKPNCLGIVFFLCLYTLARSRPRLLFCMVGGIIAGAVLAVGYSSYVFGRVSCWIEWVHNAMTYTDHPEWCSPDMGNHSITYAVKQLTGVSLSLPLGVILMAAPIVVILGSKNRRFIGESSVLIASLGALTFMLSPQLVWLHYELASLPAIFVLMRPSSTYFPYQRAITMIVLAMLSIDYHLVLGVGLNSMVLSFCSLLEIGMLYVMCLYNLWYLERRSEPTSLPAKTANNTSV